VDAPCEKSQSQDAELKELKESLLELCIGPKRKILPDALNLIDLEFAVFGGISWESEFCRTGTHPARKARLKDFHRLCKLTCQQLKIKYRYVLFYYRDEPSPAGEWHSHFLIGANGTETVTHAVLAAKLQETWTKKLNKGKAKIEPFDQTRQFDGVSYLCKVSRDGNGNEIANFPVLSKALLNLIQKKNAGLNLPIQGHSVAL
jgi:hypothetical protein